MYGRLGNAEKTFDLVNVVGVLIDVNSKLVLGVAMQVYFAGIKVPTGSPVTTYSCDIGIHVSPALLLLINSLYMC